MTHGQPGRLLVDGAASGIWNMAVDEALVESAATDGGLCLRFYTWNEPTLSLGYFQSAAERAGHAPSRGLPLVRRLTGGGAIVHDHELTYSISVPLEHPLARQIRQLYLAVHRSLVEALTSFGIAAELQERDENQSPEPFLCFARRAEGDVLIGSAKIAGSAQRRRRGAVLQHGSVLLERSPAADELRGLADQTAFRVTSDQLADLWLPALAAALGTDFRPSGLTEQETQHAQLAETKFCTDAWNLRR